MAIRINRISGKSALFRRGDSILSVNGRAVDDQLDMIYALSTAERVVRLKVKRGDEILSMRISVDEFQNAGVEFERMRFKRCRSKCIFCFVDQMPEGLRRSLYLKDDDYRLSFLFGNYVTLNDLKEEEMERIIEYHLSPLYVSVHAVNKDVRERLFGRPIKHDIIDLLKRLGDNGISFHTQVVLIPGINDGAVLEETVDTLFSLHPACLSVAVVPVGLTDHRVGLTEIRGVSVDEASSLVEWARNKGDYFREQTDQGTRFLYLADELYLMADVELPGDRDYDGYPQLSNGVGMCRSFLNELEYSLGETDSSMEECRFAVITGSLGYSFFNRYVSPLLEKRAPWLKPSYIETKNRLFGEMVTVSGLLSGRDMIEAARGHEHFDLYVVPPNSINNEGKFLDDLEVGDIADELGARVVVPDATFVEDMVIQACRRA